MVGGGEMSSRLSQGGGSLQGRLAYNVGLRDECMFVVHVWFNDCRDGTVVIIEGPDARRLGGKSDVIVFGEFELVAEPWNFDTNQEINDHHNRYDDPIVS